MNINLNCILFLVGCTRNKKKKPLEHCPKCEALFVDYNSMSPLWSRELLSENYVMSLSKLLSNHYWVQGPTRKPFFCISSNLLTADDTYFQFKRDNDQSIDFISHLFINYFYAEYIRFVFFVTNDHFKTAQQTKSLRSFPCG